MVEKVAGFAAAGLLAFAAPAFGQMMGQEKTPPTQTQAQQSSQQGQSQSQTQQQGQQNQGQQNQGQQGQQGQGAQGTTTAPAQPAAPPVDPKEEAAYKQFANIPGNDAKSLVNSGESFIQTYPNSRYNGVVYSRLTNAYMQIGDDKKMFEAGDKALAVIPDNVDVLPALAMAYSRRIDAGAMDADQKLRKVETYANSGILLLNQLQKPANAGPEWDRSRDLKLAWCHSALGLADYDRQKYTESVQQFTEAIKLGGSDPDPVDQYLLGMAFVGNKDFTNAVPALDACSKDQQLGPTCQKARDDAKKKASGQPKQ